MRDMVKATAIKQQLLEKLKEEKVFWSYEPESISLTTVSDEYLIALTMRHLDLLEIKLLFRIFTKKRIKSAWKRILVPEGDYLYTLNRFFAWYYFDAKNPDSYLKSLITRHYNNLLKQSCPNS